MPAIDKLAKATLQNMGQSGGLSSSGNPAARNIYPALVLSSEDPLGMKRIIAKIVSLDENGEINGGRDRDTPDEQLPFAVPMMPNHFHIVPIEGEMVYILLENPSDNSAPRYYMGSQINSQFKLKFQAYEEAERVFKNTDFNLNKNKDSNLETAATLPRMGDIAIQGRTDADLILKPREVFLVAGKFNKGTTSINKTTPSYMQLIQLENTDEDVKGDSLMPRYSQTNLVSTNVNIFSPLGKYRAESLKQFEINEDLKSFGGSADALHPAVFGDELIKFLDIVVRVMLNHVHTPQMPLVPIPESDELSAYTIEGELQKLISNHIRIN